MFERIVTSQIRQAFHKGKVIILLWPRQVGKTTLIESLLTEVAAVWDVARFHGEYAEDFSLLNSLEFGRITSAIWDRKWIFIDEGQKIPNIGNVLKILVDHYKESRTILVSGSSSFHLLSNTAEPLTGRKRVFNLYPISFKEMVLEFGNHEVVRMRDQTLIYGTYPAVLNAKSPTDKKQELFDLSSSALYRDIVEFQDIRNPAVLTKLLKLVALQIGQEVSLNALAQEIGINNRTVERYIDLLEKSFVIYRLPPYFTNKRKEIIKMQKIYFFDLGIRNAILGQYGAIEDRTDKWSIWENYCMTERKKWQAYRMHEAQAHFWRGRNGAQEIDLLEDAGGALSTFEFKWKPQKSKLPTEFKSLYGEIPFQEIHTENYGGFFGV